MATLEMTTVELNIPAKAFSFKTEQIKRRNEMAKWRKLKVLVFQSKKDMDDWFNYTKWHKRPHKVSNQWGNMHVVTFLDNMKGAK